jgi:hypothetical protein
LAEHHGPGAVLPNGGKYKQDALAEAGLSTSTVYRYEELAGPPEVRDAARSETERYSRQARNIENEKRAVEIRIRAERRCG